MKIENLKEKLENKLKFQTVSSNVLLSKCRLIDETSRKSGQYQDPFYFPLYYHLSKFVQPKSIMQIGLYLGFPLCCFLQGSESVDRIFCFQNKDGNFYSEKLAISNIKDVRKSININYYYGSIFDREFQKYAEIMYDLILVNEEKTNADSLNNLLDICWACTNLDGLIIVDKVRSDANINKCFINFCKINNRDPILINTRYGTGIVQK